MNLLQNLWSRKGNSLVLFNYVDKQGKLLYDMITKKYKSKSFLCFWWNRCNHSEEIRKIIEKWERNHRGIVRYI